MTGHPFAELSDKEREVLRLLRAGHDAKSIAIELQISVHTVNDRLRNARQKLGVSNSREAARILWDAERGAPQSFAHTSFGMVGERHATDTADLINTKPGAPFGFTWLAGGMLIMSLFIAAAIIGVVYSGDSGGPLPVASQATASASAKPVIATDTSTQKRAESFLKLVDAGNWQASWEAAGDFFQSQATAGEWAEIIEPVRVPLGSVKSRELASVQRVSTVPGAPEGDYQILQYKTQFASRNGEAVETVVMLKGKANYEVVGYFIN